MELDQCAEEKEGENVVTIDGTEVTEEKDDSFAKQLNCVRDKLLNMIDVENGLLDTLLSSDVLNQQQFVEITSRHNEYDKMHKLLDAAIENNRPEQFFEALCENQHSHTVAYVRNGGLCPEGKIDNWPVSYSTQHISLLDRHRNKIIEMMDLNNGLLDDLYERYCVNHRLREQIEADSTNTRKNERLFLAMRRKSVADFNLFIDCLRRTKQGHLSSLLAPGTAHGESPLSEEKLTRLQQNYNQLVNMIDIRGGLLDELFGSECITSRHHDHITSSASQIEQTKRLLNLIKIGSESTFEKFVKCLNETGQQHASSLLSGEGVAAHFVANISSTTSIKEDEASIVEQFKKYYRCQSDERKKELLKELAQHDVELAAANLGHSIGLVFICKSARGQRYLHEMYIEGRLKAVVADLFNKLLEDFQPFEVHRVQVDSLKWTPSSYAKCMAFYYSAMKMPLLSEIYQLAQNMLDDVAVEPCAILRIEDLPFELIEILLKTTACKLFRTLHRVTPRAEVYTVATLCAVSKLWWLTFTCRTFTKVQLKSSFRHSCRPFRCNPKLMANIAVNGVSDVTGIVRLNKTLFVTCSESNAIRVFKSSPPFSRLDDIKIDKVVNPTDMVAHSDKDKQSYVIYIADYKECAIWRVHLKLPSYSESVDKFIDLKWQPRTLSHNFGRLLITPRDGDSLSVYDGKTVTAIPLPDYMWALHSVETAQKTFVVCHRNAVAGETKSKSNGISEVDDKGSVVRVVVDTAFTGVGSTPLNWPRYLLLDVDGHGLVADRLNDRLVLLESLKSDLQLKRVLLSALSGQPFRLCLDSDSGLLYVACSYSTVFSVYKIKKSHR